MSLLRECADNTDWCLWNDFGLCCGFHKRRKAVRQQSDCCIQWQGPWERRSAVWGGSAGCTIATGLFGKCFHTIL